MESVTEELLREFNREFVHLFRTKLSIVKSVLGDVAGGFTVDTEDTDCAQHAMRELELLLKLQALLCTEKVALSPLTTAQTDLFDSPLPTVEGLCIDYEAVREYLKLISLLTGGKAHLSILPSASSRFEVSIMGNDRAPGVLCTANALCVRRFLRVPG